MSSGEHQNAPLTDEQVQRAYRDYLWREPDEPGRRARVGKIIASDALAKAFAGSAEYCERIAPALEAVRAVRSPKVLLFGAFGNGNLGDDIQAEAMAELVRVAVPSCAIFATSCFRGDYRFELGKTLQCGAIYSHLLLAEFDLLIIGGGGLLAHPHEPLADRLWIQDLRIPTMFFGVGVHGSFVEEASATLREAIFVGCRDDTSVQAAARFTPRFALTLDPVLLSLTLTPPGELRNGFKRYRRCWIIRDPIDQVLIDVRAQIDLRDIVIGLEPMVDQHLCTMFPELRLIQSLAEAWEIICASEVVIAMRYHGVILAIKAGVSTYALRVSKAARLLALMGHSDRVLESSHLDQASLDPIRCDEQLQVWRETGISHLAAQYQYSRLRTIGQPDPRSAS